MHITTIKPEASESKKIISILPYSTALHHHHFDVYIGSIDCRKSQSREHL